MLPRQHRIVDGADFRRIQRGGTKIRLPYFVLAIHPSERPPRFGFLVGKDVGGAVVRNRLKRQLRHLAARAIQEGMVGGDIVVRAVPDAKTASFRDLEAAFFDGIQKAGLRR